MKRTGALFDHIFTPGNLYKAYLDARQGKRTKQACHQFGINLGAELSALHQELHDGSYRPRPYHTFVVYEPKRREIHAPAFRDIVAQHAIYRVIYPIFDRTFISTSFACRKGYGTHRASLYTQAALRACHPDDYFAQFDVRKFFPSIDRTILCGLIERKIKDARLVAVMMLYAHNDGDKGIPIGNLLSQLYALIYLNPLDQHAKRVLKIGHYVRYVDDFVAFGLSRPACLDLKARIEVFLKETLALTLSKAVIAKVRSGINFCGYRTYLTHRLIRKYSLHKFRRSITNNRIESVVSLLGHAANTRSWPYLIQQLKEAYSAKALFIPENHRRLYHLCAAG